MARDRDLRSARQGIHEAASSDSGESAWNVRRALTSCGDETSAQFRRDGDRAAARASIRPRLAPRRPRTAKLLGLQLHRISRGPQRIFVGRTARAAGAGIQADGEDAAR